MPQKKKLHKTYRSNGLSKSQASRLLEMLVLTRQEPTGTNRLYTIEFVGRLNIHEELVIDYLQSSSIPFKDGDPNPFSAEYFSRISDLRQDLRNALLNSPSISKVNIGGRVFVPIDSISKGD